VPAVAVVAAVRLRPEPGGAVWATSDDALLRIDPARF
jgi:hypothetical protein